MFDTFYKRIVQLNHTINTSLTRDGQVRYLDTQIEHPVLAGLKQNITEYFTKHAEIKKLIEVNLKRYQRVYSNSFYCEKLCQAFFKFVKEKSGIEFTQNELSNIIDNDEINRRIDRTRKTKKAIIHEEFGNKNTKFFIEVYQNNGENKSLSGEIIKAILLTEFRNQEWRRLLQVEANVKKTIEEMNRLSETIVASAEKLITKALKEKSENILKQHSDDQDLRRLVEFLMKANDLFALEKLEKLHRLLNQQYRSLAEKLDIADSFKKYNTPSIIPIKDANLIFAKHAGYKGGFAFCIRCGSALGLLASVATLVVGLVMLGHVLLASSAALTMGMMGIGIIGFGLALVGFAATMLFASFFPLCEEDVKHHYKRELKLTHDNYVGRGLTFWKNTDDELGYRDELQQCSDEQKRVLFEKMPDQVEQERLFEKVFEKYSNPASADPTDGALAP